MRNTIENLFASVPNNTGIIGWKPDNYLPLVRHFKDNPRFGEPRIRTETYAIECDHPEGFRQMRRGAFLTRITAAEASSLINKRASFLRAQNGLTWQQAVSIAAADYRVWKGKYGNFRNNWKSEIIN